MATSKSRYGPLVIALIAVTAVGGALAWARYKDTCLEEIAIADPAPQAEAAYPQDTVSDEVSEPQKIDINRAESWLLTVLPGIGETRAEAIVAYRDRNGPFQSINEINRVEGIGPSTYEGIKGLITTGD